MSKKKSDERYRQREERRKQLDAVVDRFSAAITSEDRAVGDLLAQYKGSVPDSEYAEILLSTLRELRDSANRAELHIKSVVAKQLEMFE